MAKSTREFKYIIRESQFDGSLQLLNKTTFKPIPTDEPVVIFRAQDAYLPQALRYYLGMCEANGCGAGHAEGLRRLVEEVETWQATNAGKVKNPD